MLALRFLIAAAGGTLIAVAACSAFSGAPATSEPTDAATEAEGGTTPGDGATQDGPPSENCVRQPINPSDAGEDASCVATPSFLDIDPNNCGRCNHSCLGESCANGRCAVTNVTTGEVGPPYLAGATPDGIAYSTSGATWLNAAVRRVPLDGGSPFTLYSFASSDGGVTGYADTRVAPNGDVYAVDRPRGVVKIAAQGGSPVVLVSGPAQFGYLALDNANIYWGSRDGLQGGPIDDPADALKTFTLYQRSNYWISAVNADGANIYWSAHPVPSTKADAEIYAHGKAKTDSPTLVAAEQSPVSQLAFDAEYVYWSTVAGDVWRIRKGSGPAASPELVTQSPTSFKYAKALVVDAVYVYAAMTKTSDDGDVNVDLIQASKCGGPARVLAKDVIYTTSILATASHLYWGRAYSIARIAK